MAVLFASTYPDRVSALVLHETAAFYAPADESIAARDERRAFNAGFAAAWGTEETLTLQLFAPSVADDPSYAGWEPRYERQSATPRGIEELLSMLADIDITSLLSGIAVPTLVIHRSGDELVPVENARFLAAHIPGTLLAEFDGRDHFPHIGDTSGWLAAVEEFVTGRRIDRPVRRRAERRTVSTEIRTLGRFSVIRDGEEVPTSSWGSRQARQLCKRLAVITATAM